MKKNVIAILAVSIVLAVFGIVSIMGNRSRSNALSVIGPEKAKEIAFASCGYSVADANEISVEFDKVKGRDIYEVEFEIDNLGYDYYIDAYTGAIIESKIPSGNTKNQPEVTSDKEKPEQSNEPANPSVQSDQPVQNSNSTPSGVISESEAKALVLARVPGASEANFTKFHLDLDDGRYEYEGELIYNDMEYDFEMDAYSGNFRDWDAESIYD